MAREGSLEDRDEEARRNAAEASARTARQVEVDRREAIKVAQAKAEEGGAPPLVRSV